MATFYPTYPQDLEGQLRQITRQGTTVNGIYGVKLFSSDLDRLARTNWSEQLPDLRFVWLSRRDLLGQAISRTRLAQTNQYFAQAEATGEPFYDAKYIAEEIDSLACGQARWAAFFARRDLAPLCLEYEDIASNPQQAANKIARLVGVKETATVDLGQVYTRVQRDRMTDEWRKRFVNDAQDPTFPGSTIQSSTARGTVPKLAGKVRLLRATFPVNRARAFVRRLIHEVRRFGHDTQGRQPDHSASADHDPDAC